MLFFLLAGHALMDFALQGDAIIGRPFDEETLFATAQVIEDAAGRMTLPPAWWA